MTIARINFKNCTHDNLKGVRCVRNVGKYKVYAEHFDCALPYTIYYIVDTKENTVYMSEECHFSYLENIINALKER